MEGLNALYQAHGVDLGDLRPVAGLEKAALRGALVVCPPSALADRWARRFDDPVVAMASGWMRVKQRAKQAGVELPLILSDHADWDELTATLADVGAPRIWVTHGREEALVHWARLAGFDAQALSLVGYEEEGS
jgi:putative mRNA 3-end processing factor